MKLTLSELSEILKMTIDCFKHFGVAEISFAAEDYYLQVSRTDLDFDNPEFLRCPPCVIGSLDADFDLWKMALKNRDAIYGMSSGAQISSLGGILTIFGQVSKKLNNPSPIKNTTTSNKPPETLTLHELGKIFDLVIESLKMNYFTEISFDDPRYIKIAPKREYFYMACRPYTVESLDEAMMGWKEILSGRCSPSALDIERLGYLLMAFGEEMNS